MSGLLAALALHAAMIVAVDSVRPQWRDPEFYHRYQKLAAALRANRRTQAHSVVAVLGSSRPQMGFSPDHAADGYGPGAPLIFNLSQSGCHPIGERLNLQRILNAPVRPDFVLIEVWASGLARRTKREEQIPMSRLSLSDLATVSPYLYDEAAARRQWWQIQASPWWTYRMNVLAHQGLESLSPAERQQNFLWSDMRPNGWSPYYPPVWSKEEQERRQALAMTWFAEPLGEFHLDPNAESAHRDLLTACRTHGLKAALYLMPESPTFRTLYSADAKREVRDYLTRLSDEFGVPVCDASEWIADDAAYMDGYHLLGPGAEAFSRRLGRDLLRGWVPPNGHSRGE
ncbi:hypothetical protein [Limnoglobus roseus]|uniref:hypothetical protein n=1 Tax=Limnoglobus roseus TaxID=2598579 RepID=UPI0011EAD604|nr:hypothetical protein [Limnoglobus roseus]